MKKAILISVGVLLSIFTSGQIIHVPADYSTMQEAIDAANPYDTVLVDPGTYYEHIIMPDKSLVIGSLFLTTQDTNYIEQTIIDGSHDGRVLFFPYTDEAIFVSGFTIQNGQLAGTVSWGAGVCTYTASNLTLTDLVVKSNTVETGGGGMALVGYSQVELYNTKFIGNKATGSTTLQINGEGGGLYMGNCALNCANCIFENNSADLGGAIWTNGGIQEFQECIFTANSANYLGNVIAAFGGQESIFDKCRFANHPLGALFEPYNANIAIKNCLIANNRQILASTNTGADIKVISSTFINNSGGDHSFYLSQENSLYMFNTIFWNSGKINIKWNNTVYLSNTLLQNGMDGIEIEYTGNNVYSSGPVFDANPYFMDSLDYHLADWSPAIGAGADSVEMNGLWFYSPISDFDSNPRPSPYNTNPDLGAFENMLGLPVGIANREMDNTTDVQIFPNPASTYCQIIFPDHFPEKALLITVFNINGKMVEEQTISKFQNSIYLDVSNYISGVYTVVGRTDDGYLNPGKFIVRHNQ